MRLTEVRRFPIKSLLGERLTTVEIDDRGLVGDRLYAIRDADGKLGSGKNTRRFRRMPGLLNLRGQWSSDVATVELADGDCFAWDDPLGHAAVSAALGRPVTIARETDVRHHDEGPVSIITSTGLRRLGELLDRPVEAVRFRANLLVDVPGSGFVDDEWLGRVLRIGTDVVLHPQRPLTRCVMVDLAQRDLPEHGRILRTITEDHDMTFGIWATVERGGRVTVGDDVVVGDGFPTHAR